PIRSLLHNQPNTEILMAEVTGVDVAGRRVLTADRAIEYDQLVIATGSTHSYFGHEDWRAVAPGLKTIADATAIRRKVLRAFEAAEMESDPARRRELLRFVIVGGGPTGVELAGALGEISRYTLEKDFRHIDPRRTRVVLIEAGKRVLATFHPECSARALRDLERLGVNVWTGTRGSRVPAEGVSMGEEFLRARTVIWAAGVQPSPLNRFLSTDLDKRGRVKAENDLSLTGHPNVFVVGDQALFEQDGVPLPGLAPVAMQQGREAARNILRLSRGEKTKAFRYHDKGTMATIGRLRAVVEFGKLHFFGLAAWITWLFVHIYYLIGFRNRIFVLVQWIWSYATFGRGARLIVHKNWKMEK
ncbi:MAG: NAD(P)/FAD-dependent oxidoreductase, partial [Bdellovibrionota bacterium]